MQRQGWGKHKRWQEEERSTGRPGAKGTGKDRAEKFTKNGHEQHREETTDTSPGSSEEQEKINWEVKTLNEIIRETLFSYNHLS